MIKATTAGLTALAATIALALSACGQDQEAADAAAPDEADATEGADATEAVEPASDVDPAVADAAVVPERYFGLYGDAEHPEELYGMVFVTAAKPPPMADRFPELPPDYIMIGALWADVANFYMKPVSPTRFEQDFLSEFDPAPLVAKFELDMAGNAIAVTFEGALEDFGRRARLRDLPEEYR